MEGIKLISVNIERSKHLQRVITFLKQETADVICLHELMEGDIPFFEQELDMKALFVPSTRHNNDGNPGVEGSAIFTALTVVGHGTEYYWGKAGEIRDFDVTSAGTKHETQSYAILCADVRKAEEEFRIATTHFTWTADGQADDLQRADLKKMLEILEKLREFVLCGDFNAPRGLEIFTAIAGKYKDNIPLYYVTSLDRNLHRAGHLDYVVDGLFTTPEYNASDVRLQDGVSDHCAIIARIGKA